MAEMEREELIGRVRWEMTHDNFCTQERWRKPTHQTEHCVVFAIRDYTRDCPTIGQLIDILKSEKDQSSRRLMLKDAIVAFNYLNPYEEDVQEKKIYLVSSVDRLPPDTRAHTMLTEVICTAIDETRPWTWHARQILRFDKAQKRTQLGY